MLAGTAAARGASHCMSLGATIRHAAGLADDHDGDNPQAPVPGEQGARCHEPVQPQVPGQQPGERGDHGPVGPVQLRTGDLAAQHGDLVPQYQDLDVLEGVVAGEQRQPAEQRAISR